MTTVGIAATETDRLNGLWAVAGRAGLHSTPAVLEGAVVRYSDALAVERAARLLVADAAGVYDDAAGLAAMICGREVTKDGAKSFVPDVDGPRQVSADEAKAWVARKVCAEPVVAEAAAALREAKLRSDEARDGVAVAEHRIKAARAAVDAAVTLGRLLTTAFDGRQL